MAAAAADLYWAFFTDIPHIASRFRRFASPGVHVRDHPRDGWTLTTVALPTCQRPVPLSITQKSGGAKPGAEIRLEMRLMVSPNPETSVPGRRHNC